MSVFGICLAAGQASRMGCSKQLLPWGKDTVLSSSLRALLCSKLAGVALVLGAYREQIIERLQREIWPKSYHIAVNENWNCGMSTSIQIGLREAVEEERRLNRCFRGLLVGLGDMPFITTELVDDMICKFDSLRCDAILAPTFAGKRGHPVIIGRDYWTELNELRGDCGAASILRRHSDKLVLVEGTISNLYDVDTLEQWEKARLKFESIST